MDTTEIHIGEAHIGKNERDRAQPRTLYLVATPLGNMRDITLRALDILASATVIAAESTLRAHRLLREYRIQSRQLLVCGAGNEAASAEGIVRLLQRGQSVAYISDAGTPGLSDPGGKLVCAVCAAGFAVEALPGPSALALLVSLAGFSCKPLSFVGFLSPKPTRKNRQLEYWLAQEHSFLLYESPFRLIATLKALTGLAPGRKIVLARELTKKNAQVFRGTADYVYSQLKEIVPLKGEFALLVASQKL